MTENGRLGPGDLVRLKSGGPLMTCRHLAKDSAGDPGMACAWFTQTVKCGSYGCGSLSEIVFPLCLLEKVD